MFSASDPERNDSRPDEDNLVAVARVYENRSETEVKKMMNTKVQLVFRKALSIVCVLLVLQFGTLLAAQELPPAPEQAGPPAQALSPERLANLVAPIALYPDALLSQVLVAATYPLEIVEAAQWLQQNRDLRGTQLVEAARQQNWDASVQALVVFPDVVGRLNSDIRWTTDLGNAFLAQQADVMNAVQSMRAQARAAGKLNSTPQETVTTQTQGGQTVIEIQPANPQVVYVPTYNPEYIWGPPLYGYYPGLYYPQIGFGFGFGLGVFIGGFFGGLGWGGWGWGPSWFGHSIYVNNSFFSHYGYGGYHGGGSYYGHSSWAHDPGHRSGVPYSNRAVASRYAGGAGSTRSAGQSYAASRQAPLSRMNSGGNSGNRGNPGANSASPRSFSQQGGARSENGGFSRGAASNGASQHASSAQTNSAQGWQRFGGTGSGTSQAAAASGRGGWSTTASSRPSSPAYSTGGGYRSSSTYAGSAGSYGGSRTTSGYRASSPAYSTGGGYRSGPSVGGSAGSYGGSRSASSYRPSSPAHSSGGSSSGGRSASSHPSGSGGGSHSGGGSSHSSGGGHRR
jgi:hypothetical protein